MPNDPLKIGSVLRSVVGDKRIEDLPLPLYIVAVDLVEAKQVIIDKGLLYEAVSASCAVPLFFKPLIRGKQHLVDGGLLNNIPADILRMAGADNVVTIDINPTRGGGGAGLGIMDVAKATLSIMTASSSHTGLINSDIIIAPNLSAYASTKKDGYQEMMTLGYKSAAEKIGDIKQLMGIKLDAAPKKIKEKKIKEKKPKEKKIKAVE
jgi:NTE family protein